MLDKFRETAITWDKANRKVYEPLRVSAGDNKGRKLSVQVVNGGVIESLSGASLSLFWETKDKAHKGLDAFTAVDATKGEFEIYYTTGMLSNEGVLNANLVLVDTSGRVVSEPFKITVFKGIDDEAIQSSDSFTALTEALAQVGNINNKADRAELLALESTFEQNKLSVEQQLQQKVGGGKRATLNDLGEDVLTAIEGGEGTNFSLLSEPADNSVTLQKINASIYKNEWAEYIIEPTNGAKHAFVEHTYQRPLQGTGAIPCTVEFDFYSTDPNVKQIKVHLYNNNSATVATGGESRTGTTVLDYTTGKLVHYKFTITISAIYEYAHNMVAVLPIDTTVPQLHFFVGNFSYAIQGETPTFLGKKVYLGNVLKQVDNVKLPIQLVTYSELQAVAEIVDGGGATTVKTGYEDDDGVAFGDSITWQDGRPYAKAPFVGVIAKGYQTIVKDKLGLASYVNQGSNGATIVSLLNYLIRPYNYANADFATLFLLTNDFGNNTPLGTLGTTAQTTFDETTAYGAYRAAVDHILTQNPTIKLFLITPMFRNYNYPTTHEMDKENTAGHTMKQYQQIPRDIGEMYSLPVIDLAKYSGLNNKNATLLTLDGLHPNDMFYEVIGEFIANEMMRYR